MLHCINLATFVPVSRRAAFGPCAPKPTGKCLTVKHALLSIEPSLSIPGVLIAS